MKKRKYTKLITLAAVIVMAISFCVPFFITVHADTTNTITSLLTGKELNAAVKKLAGDTLPADNSISSLYLVEDTKITGIERASVVDSTASIVNLSSDGSGSVVAWLDNTTIKWYSTVTTIYLNSDSSYLFYGFKNMQSMSNLSDFNASKAENLSYMFDKDIALTSLDLSEWQTDKAVNLSYMFADMTNLVSLNVNNMNTALVTDMSDLFLNDSALASVDLSSFTVNKDSTNLTDAFKDSGLAKIYVSKTWGADYTKDARFSYVLPAWFTQTLTMSVDEEMKNITFSYGLTAGEHIDSSDGGLSISAGLLSTDCSVGTASFSAADATTAGSPTNADNQYKKYMSHKVKILIDADQYTEPGIYRYILTETTRLTGVDEGLFKLDSANQRVLDVFVEYTDDNTLQATTSVLHKTATSATNTSLDTTEKASGFDNEYLLTTNDLIVRNKVSGNQSDEKQIFQYTLAITKDIPYRTLTAVRSDGKLYSIDIGETGAGNLSFELSGTQRITVRDIQKKAMYVISANKATLKESHIDVKAMASSDASTYGQEVVYSLDTDTDCTITNLDVDEDIDVTFLNVKDGIVPTGVMLRTAPYALTVAIGLMGILVIRKKQKYDNEALDNSSSS
jgi:surface protein